MKTLFVALFSFVCSAVAAQSPSQQLSGRIADRMKDSLGLTVTDRDKVYELNVLISNRKADARLQHGNADSLRFSIQKIENSRDSLYKSVLPPDKFLLYTQKKRNLINNN